MSGKSKLISAAVIAAALMATVAVARVHTNSAKITLAVHETVGLAPTQSVPLRNFACAPSIQATCEKLDWFPE